MSGERPAAKASKVAGQRQVRTKLIQPQSWTHEQKMYIWEKWEQRRGTCSMVTFAKEVRLEGIKDGVWDHTREFNRNVVAGIVGGLKQKLLGPLGGAQQKKRGAAAVSTVPAVSPAPAAASSSSTARPLKRERLPNGVALSTEYSGTDSSETDDDTAKGSKFGNGQDERIAIHNERVQRAEQELQRCRLELQQLNSKIDGILGVLQNVLPPDDETKDQEAAASLTTLFSPAPPAVKQ